jgi:hypothetical protein
MRRSCCGANCLAMQMPNQCSIGRLLVRALALTCKSVKPVFVLGTLHP